MVKVPASRGTERRETSLAYLLDGMTHPGELYECLDGDAVQCVACGHRCLIREGRRGICQVRFNKGGALYVPHGYAAGSQVDPVEKKPFFHLLPGSNALTFGMLGCDFHCGYCQNWLTSQALRDPAAGVAPQPISAAEIGSLADKHGAKLVVSSYNEPLITSEWAVDVFQEARKRGMRCAYVSNGNATPEVLTYLRPWVVSYKIDLKTMNDRNYRQLGGVLDHVLETIRQTVAMGFWVEIVTLIVPGFNDSEGELHEAARFIATVSPGIPWHVTAFHKNYKMTDPGNTSVAMLTRATEIGYEEGLHFVYAGNIPGQVGPYEDTRCPGCNETLVRRRGFRIMENRVTGEGACPDCSMLIPGIWN